MVCKCKLWGIGNFEDREEGKTIKEEGMQASVGKECGMRG
jgi:hypothetical protein